MTVEFRPMQSPGDLIAFRDLNEEWISHYFELEPRDHQTLRDPQNSILKNGGMIYMACVHDEPVGCVALLHLGNGEYELSKMAVASRLRGGGIGRKLLRYAIEEAKKLGATSLFLGSSSKLQNAVHLYESVGFQHVLPEQIPPMPYTRANVFMRMEL